MESTSSSPIPGPGASSIWTAAAALCLAGAVVLTGVAVGYQLGESRPRGEGELFLAEAGQARSVYADALGRGDTSDVAVRRVRNALGVEAVGVVDSTGVFLASTSPNWVGRAVEPPLLLAFLDPPRFGAVTASLSAPVLIDGVVEWGLGTALYQVMVPLETEGALVLSYDVSDLLSRRAGEQGIRPLTLVMAGGSVVLLVAGVLLLVARAGARRKVAEAAREAERIRRHSRDLESHNLQLAEARDQAERALALAEETNRIRSEFVLMINHELRTPLTSVVTGAELLNDEGLGEDDRRQVLVDMVRDGRRLQELISQMLTVARIENRGLGYSLREIPFDEAIAQLEVGLSGRHRCGGDGIRSSVEGSALQVRTDLDSLTQLLVSLADNSITHGATRVCLEAVSELPFSPMLSVGAIPADPVYFLVIDDGPGIDGDFLPRAFEKFEKQGRSSGTGLGLYMARLMVEAIEGAILVTTGPEGTTIAVALPTARATVAQAVGK